MNGSSFRTAVAAILAGLLYFAGQAGELAFSSADDSDAVFIAFNWILPLVAVAGLVVGLTVTADPIHDIGLFVFEAAWVALGVTLLTAKRRQPHGMPPAGEPAT